MTALPYATIREDITDAADELADFGKVMEDAKARLNLAKQILGASGSTKEIDELFPDLDALVEKADAAERVLRAFGRRAERGLD